MKPMPPALATGSSWMCTGSLETPAFGRSFSKLNRIEIRLFVSAMDSAALDDAGGLD